jgi:hypothetical protein
LIQGFGKGPDLALAHTLLNTLLLHEVVSLRIDLRPYKNG